MRKKKSHLSGSVQFRPLQLKQILFIPGTKGIILWQFRFSMLGLGVCGVSSEKPWLVFGGALGFLKGFLVIPCPDLKKIIPAEYLFQGEFGSQN